MLTLSGKRQIGYLSDLYCTIASYRNAAFRSRKQY